MHGCAPATPHSNLCASPEPARSAATWPVVDPWRGGGPIHADRDSGEACPRMCSVVVSKWRDQQAEDSGPGYRTGLGLFAAQTRAAGLVANDGCPAVCPRQVATEQVQACLRQGDPDEQPDVAVAHGDRTTLGQQ